MTVTGRTLAEKLSDVPDGDREVIRSFATPLKPTADYVVMSGNLFDSAVMKISVIDQDFRKRFLSNPEHLNVLRRQSHRSPANAPARHTGGNCRSSSVSCL